MECEKCPDNDTWLVTTVTGAAGEPPTMLRRATLYSSSDSRPPSLAESSSRLNWQGARRSQVEWIDQRCLKSDKCFFGLVFQTVSRTVSSLLPPPRPRQSPLRLWAGSVVGGGGGVEGRLDFHVIFTSQSQYLHTLGSTTT